MSDNDHNGPEETFRDTERKLREQLEAARADAKEAEAYAEELERERDEWKSLAEATIKDDASKNIYYAELKAKLANCEKYRDAYAECDRIGTQAVRDLEAKLAKALGIGNKMAKSIEGNYYIPGVVKEWRATISDLKQEGSKT